MRKQIGIIISLLLLFFGILFSQNTIKKVTSESDITDNRFKSNLEVFVPVNESPKAIKGAIYADPTKSAHERAKDLIRRLTFEEKLNLTGGYQMFQVAPVERLGIRPVFMADASQGVRLKTISVEGKSTSFPGMLPLASTWNTYLAKEFGKAIADECRTLGVDILLGPGINMQRLSVGGRNFEYMGEDPFLTSMIALNYVQGMEGQGIVSCPKHFIGNDQEFCRHIANIIADERTLREIYLPPWETVIKEGHCSSIMTGNNMVNGIPVAIHKELNADLLRREYGFEGIAMTDWQNTNYFPTMQNLVLPSGENLLMPQNRAFLIWLDEEIKKSTARKDEIEIMLENMIYPTLFTLFKKGVYDRLPQDNNYLRTYETHKKVAREVAEESIVMLKNEKNILPIPKGKKIVMCGAEEIHSGEGSGYVIGYDHCSFAEGLKSVYGTDFIYLQNFDENVLRKADVIIFNFNKKSGEGRDVPFEEGNDELKDLRKIIKLKKDMVVLINSCNTMPMDWLKDVKGLLWCYFLGQERGNALASIVSGSVSPSGKLPFTIEKDFKNSPAPEYNYIGKKPLWIGHNEYKKYWMKETNDFDTAFTNYIKPFEPVRIPYLEKTLIGYRWYDYHKIPVHFPFGFGLSYSTFKLSNMAVSNSYKQNENVTVEVDIQNIGKCEAKEVIQIYISDTQSSVVRAPKELKAFRKVNLKSGEKKRVTFTLKKNMFSFWCEQDHKWLVEPGEFVIHVGMGTSDVMMSKAIII